MQEMMNRAERFCADAEMFAQKGIMCMSRYLFEKDIEELEKRGFEVNREKQKLDGSYYCFIMWGMRRSLTFMESQYISWGGESEDDIPKTNNFAEHCALISLRAQAKQYGDNTHYSSN